LQEIKKLAVAIRHPVAPQNRDRIQFAARPHAFSGYFKGFRQPVLQYTLRIQHVENAQLAVLDRLLSQRLGTRFELSNGQSLGPIPDRFMYWTRAILEKAVHPVFESAKMLSQKDNLCTIAQPCLNHAAVLLVLNFLIESNNSCLRSVNGPTAESVNEIGYRWARLLKELAPTALRGFNQLHFLTAAFELGVPWTPLGTNIFQLGFGTNARWIDSSYTDATSVISSKMARNKALAASVMRSSGLPVPLHAHAKSEDDAVQCAEKLGYPVVVKPLNLDGGHGVTVNLRSPESVRQAFSSASKLTKHVLVEKHVAGRDYRLHVVNGRVHGVLDRIPGGVTGNGLDTVRVLLDRQNHERKVALDDRRFLHQMAFDEEAHEQLRTQNLSWDSVPTAECFVRLRGASNVASGGMPVPVPLKEVHQDNLTLAIRAARVLRLDVAGIDLLIPDIRQSWLETGANICEVNAQPQMFSTMHKPMLVSMLNGGDGRIPVAIVISGESPDCDIGLMLHRKLLANGVIVGLVRGGSVYIDKEFVCKNSAGSFTQSRMLFFDSAVQAMVICVEDDEIIKCGWPVDSCDVFVARSGRTGCTVAGGQHSLAHWMTLVAGLSPGLVLLEDTATLDQMTARSIFAATNDLRVVAMKQTQDIDHVVQAAVSAMITCLAPK
jgi:cyanophycin synthetase